MIWGEMSSAGVGPLCFLKTNITAPVYQDILEHFMLPSADQLFKDADFIFQQDLAPVHTAKSTKSWLNDHGVDVLDWPANSPDLNIENLWGIVERKMRDKRPKDADELKATVKETWASIPTWFCLCMFFFLSKPWVWDQTPDKCITVKDKKITSVKTKFKNASKNILHKI